VLEGGGGTGTVTSLSQPFSGTYTQTLDTGTQLNVNYAAAKLSTSNAFSTFNPSLTSNVRVDFSQPLLQNRGRYVNRLNLMIARSAYRIADYNLRTQLLNLVSGAETAYWNVIQAQKNVEVAENARKASQNNLDYVQRQLDLGAISPLDIYNPKQRVAETELQVSQAKFALTQAEDALRTQIAVDLDPDLRRLPIVLTESVDLPNVDALVYDSEELITKALANRPDVKAVVQSLDRDDLSIQQAQNGLLPNLALTGLYQSQGRGGVFYERSNVFNDQGVPSQIVTSTPGGFGDALSQMFHFNYPVYSLGLRLNLPIRSHAAAANLADALVSKKQDALRLRNTQQQVRLNVQNAITALQGSKEQLKLAKIQQDFAQKNLDAMNEKYKLGAELLPNVITAEVNLSNAQSNVVQQQVAVRRNILNMLTQTGELLEERGIMVQ
jgi:outer membrane protein TolC